MIIWSQMGPQRNEKTLYTIMVGQKYFKGGKTYRAGAKGGQGDQAPQFVGLVPLLLTIHITNIQHKYYFFNQ